MLLAVLMLLCALASGGCHGSRESTAFEIPSELNTDEKIAITFWAKNDTNISQVKVYQKAIADFEELYPNIKVNVRMYTNYGDIYEDVIINIATQTTPNVCITYPDHISTYLSGENTIVQLDALISDPRYGLGGSELKFDGPTLDEIIPEYLEECRLGGMLYGLPFLRSTEACYINKTYVEQMGYTIPEKLTWDFIWEVSDKATEKNPDGTFAVNGQKVMIPFIYKSTDNMMIQMLRQLDAPYSTEDGEILIFNDITRGILETIKSHVEKGAFSTFKISSYPANFLNAGQCIFAIDSTGGSTWMGSEAPLSDISESSIVPFETVVREIPQFDPDHPQMISQGPSICIFNKADHQEVLASWLLVQFLLTNDVQIGYSKTEGYVPVTTKAQKSEAYQDYLSRRGENNTEFYSVKIDATRLLMSHVADTFVTPVFNGSVSLRDAAGEMIENVTKSVRRKQTVDDAYFEALYEKMQSLYHLGETSVGAASSGKKALGALPQEARILLGSLGAVWVLIILYFSITRIRAAKKKRDF